MEQYKSIKYTTTVGKLLIVTIDVEHEQKIRLSRGLGHSR